MSRRVRGGERGEREGKGGVRMGKQGEGGRVFQVTEPYFSSMNYTIQFCKMIPSLDFENLSMGTPIVVQEQTTEPHI